MFRVLSHWVHAISLYTGPVSSQGMGDASALKELKDMQALQQKKLEETKGKTVTLSAPEQKEVQEFLQAVDTNEVLIESLQGPEAKEARAHLAKIKEALKHSNGTVQIPKEDFEALQKYIKSAITSLNQSIAADQKHEKTLHGLSQGHGTEAKVEAVQNLLDTFSAVGSEVNLGAAIKAGVGTKSKWADASVQVGVEGSIGLKKILNADGTGKWQTYVDLKALAEADAKLFKFFSTHFEAKVGVKAALVFDNSAQVKEFVQAMMTGDVDKLDEIIKKHKMTAVTAELGASAEVDAGKVKVKMSGKTKTELLTFADGSKGRLDYTVVTGEVNFGNTPLGKKLDLHEIGFEYEHTVAKKGAATADEKVFAVTLPLTQFKHIAEHAKDHQQEVKELAHSFAEMAVKSDKWLASLPADEKANWVTILTNSFTKGMGGSGDVGKAVQFLAKLAEKGIQEVGIGVVIQNGEVHGIEIFAKGEKKISVSGQASGVVITGELQAHYKGAILIPIGGHHGPGHH